jgi:DNA-binding CsgD family transcriptional regulator
MTPRVAKLVPRYDWGLTIREQDVLYLLASGYRYRDIAEMTHVSRDTVKEDTRTAVEKLKARNRTHAVAIAIRAGVIA